MKEKFKKIITLKNIFNLENVKAKFSKNQLKSNLKPKADTGNKYHKFSLEEIAKYFETSLSNGLNESRAK